MTGFGDSGGAARFFKQCQADDPAAETYECHPDCPLRMLDEQSGNRPGMSGGGAVDNRKSGNEVVPQFNRKPSAPFIRGDSGGGARTE